MKNHDLNKILNVSERYDELYLDVIRHVCNKKMIPMKFQNLKAFFSEFEMENLKESLTIPEFLDGPLGYSSTISRHSFSTYEEYVSSLKNLYNNKSIMPDGKNESSKGNNLSDYPDVAGLLDFQIEFFRVLVNKSGDSIGSFIAGVFRNIDMIDKRLFLFIQSIINQILSDGDKDRAIESFAYSITKFIEYIIENDEIDKDSYKILLLFGKELYTILEEYTETNDKKEEYKIAEEVISFISYYFGDYLYSSKSEASSDALYFAKRGLNIPFSRWRQDAFNNLGMLAILSGDLQLANDVYVSWLLMKSIGEIDSLLVSPSFWGPRELVWRKTLEGRKACALMHANLAYVCGTIGDTYEREDDTRKNFYNLAIENISKATSMDSDTGVFMYTYGILLSDSVIYNLDDEVDINRCINIKNEAYSYFQKYRDIVMSQNDFSEKLCSNRMCCNILRQLLFFEAYKSDSDFCEDNRIKWLYKTLSKHVDEYYDLDVVGPYDKKTEEEMNFRDDSSTVFSFSGMDSNSELRTQINILILVIVEAMNAIKDHLHRREYLTTNYDSRVIDNPGKRKGANDIAYYTTLKNIVHVFDELYIEDGKIKIDNANKYSDTKNCLTVMNSKYMNDPNEGIVFLEDLMKNIENNRLFSGKNAKEILQDVLDENFVFLKSFTEQVDKLLMWNRYANDYSEDGNNSNGCCVIVNPECFAGKAVFTDKNGILSALDGVDDYTLYRIVYISPDGTIKLANNEGLHNNVICLYEKLKEWMSKLNTLIMEYEKVCSDDIYNIIPRMEYVLKESLKSVIFLFKNTDYSDEHESRLILFRNTNNQEDVRIIPGTPPLLALNAFFQIYINEIIFGPNVRDVEKWRPYFQYNLNRMWRKNISEEEKESVLASEMYTIRKSNIDYLT